MLLISENQFCECVDALYNEPANPRIQSNFISLLECLMIDEYNIIKNYLSGRWNVEVHSKNLDIYYHITDSRKLYKLLKLLDDEQVGYEEYVAVNFSR